MPVYCVLYSILVAELGTRQHCPDNFSMFAGHKIIDYCIMSVFVAGTQFRHQVLKIFLIFFLSLKLCYVVALSLLLS